MSLIQQAKETIRKEQEAKNKLEEERVKTEEWREREAIEIMQRFIKNLGTIEGYEIYQDGKRFTISKNQEIVASGGVCKAERFNHDSDGYPNGTGQYYDNWSFTIWHNKTENKFTNYGYPDAFVRALVEKLGL